VTANRMQQMHAAQHSECQFAIVWLNALEGEVSGDLVVLQHVSWGCIDAAIDMHDH
jgi:hypothetical protein